MLATVLPIAAAANVALLAVALGRRAWAKRAPAGLYGALFLLGAAAAVTLITLDHAGLNWPAPVIAVTEGALTLAAGALLLLFTTSLLGKQVHAWPLFIPLAFFLTSAVLAPRWAAHAFLVERLVFVQMAFTLAAAFVALRHKPAGRRSANAKALALTAIGAMGALHLAQIARMLWSEIDAISNIVPFVGAIAFLAATAAVYFGGRIGALDPLIEAPAPASSADIGIADNFDRALNGDLLRDANLALPQAAASIAATPEQLSRALATVHGMSFTEYLQQRRVDEAMRLLADPDEARTSMEAIGLLVGFGSRSAFYKAFSERAGMSPAAFRAQNAPKPCPNP